MYMITPTHILAIRTAMGLSQTQFAGLLDVVENTVRRWEKGSSHPTYETMEELNDLAIKHGVDLSPKSRRVPASANGHASKKPAKVGTHD